MRFVAINDQVDGEKGPYDMLLPLKNVFNTQYAKPKTDLRKHQADEEKRLNAALARIHRLKQASYEDYRDELLAREEFLRYKADYDRQEQLLCEQLKTLQEQQPEELLMQPWVEQLVRLGQLTELDRATLAQTVKEIRGFEDKRIEMTYLFSDGVLLENTRR